MKALPIISDALALVGFVSFGEAPEAEASALAVRTLNGMLLEWSTKSIYSPAQYDKTCPSNGSTTYVLGSSDAVPSPDFLTAPKEIRQVSIEQPGGVVVWSTRALRTLADWALAMPKTIQGIPSTAFWDFQQGQSRLYLLPAAPAGYLIHVVGNSDIATIKNAQGEIDLPDEFHEALVYNLAKRLMPFMPPSADANQAALDEVRFIANTSLSGIKRRNQMMRFDAIQSDFPGVNNGRGNDGYLAWRGRAV